MCKRLCCVMERRTFNLWREWRFAASARDQEHRTNGRAPDARNDPSARTAHEERCNHERPTWTRKGARTTGPSGGDSTGALMLEGECVDDRFRSGACVRRPGRRRARQPRGGVRARRGTHLPSFEVAQAGGFPAGALEIRAGNGRISSSDGRADQAGRNERKVIRRGRSGNSRSPGMRVPRRRRAQTSRCAWFGNGI